MKHGCPTTRRDVVCVRGTDIQRPSERFPSGTFFG
jgi:hypothetical protein